MKQAILSVVALSAAMVACGNAGLVNASSEAPRSRVAVTVTGEESDTPPLSEETALRVVAAFEQMRNTGMLDAHGWCTGGSLPEQEFAVLLLHNDADDGLADGYRYDAFIPAGPIGNADNDPNNATEFYIMRSGGFGGMLAVAGPFELSY